MARAGKNNPVVLDIAYHRNGVSGDPFYVAVIADPEQGRLVACLSAEDLDADGREINPRCYVLGIDELAQGVIAFGQNSHRGDHYFEIVREAAKEHEAGAFVALLELETGPRGRPSSLAERSS